FLEIKKPDIRLLEYLCKAAKNCILFFSVWLSIVVGDCQRGIFQIHNRPCKARSTIIEFFSFLRCIPCDRVTVYIIEVTVFLLFGKNKRVKVRSFLKTVNGAVKKRMIKIRNMKLRAVHGIARIMDPKMPVLVM